MNPDSNASESQRVISQIHSSQNRRYTKAVGLIVLAVLAGAIIGAGAAMIYFKKSYHRVPPRPEAIVQSLIEHMHNVLKLEPDEETKLKEIIDRNFTEVNAIRETSREDTHNVFARMGEEIKTVIGPERYQAWDEYTTKRWGDRKRGGRRGHGNRKM